MGKQETLTMIRRQLDALVDNLPYALSDDVRLGDTEGLREAIGEILLCQHKMLEMLGAFVDKESSLGFEFGSRIANF